MKTYILFFVFSLLIIGAAAQRFRGDSDPSKNVQRHKMSSAIKFTPIKMIIYRDILTDDEIFSGTEKHKLIEDDSIYEIECKFVTRNRDGDIFPSAEEQEKELEKGLDVVLNHRLVDATGIDNKEQFKIYFRDYSKRLIAHLTEAKADAETIEKVKKQLRTAFKFLYPKSGDFQFFAGQSGDYDALLAMVVFTDAENAIMYVVAPGVVEEKV